MTTRGFGTAEVTTVAGWMCDLMESRDAIARAIGDRRDGAIGQLTEGWEATLFDALVAARGRACSDSAAASQ